METQTNSNADLSASRQTIKFKCQYAAAQQQYGHQACRQEGEPPSLHVSMLQHSNSTAIKHVREVPYLWRHAAASCTTA
jgi:hypothetical protein